MKTLACVVAVVALAAAAVADAAAALPDVVAAAASTIKFHAAELVFVNGCWPEDVCAETQIKIFPVDVSFTKSLTTYETPALQLPLYTPNS